ncbi:MAG: ABC transporter ATP-binding protein [Chloroflexi bacterium]|nr:ABC transporter ATP-binding protein [Chloroflexota bacterium]
MLVQVKNLKTHFFLTEGIVRAVDGVNFYIDRGRTLGVVGESGCGKSVTARSIMNMIRPPGRNVAGQVIYHRQKKEAQGSTVTEEIDLLTLEPMSAEMRSIRGGEFSMIFQEPRASLSPLHTIGTQIMEGLKLHMDIDDEEARQRAIEQLQRVNIPKAEERIDAYAHQLSGGMCQRAMIALALACQPALLIADEPTTSLDVTTEAQILNLMRELQDTFHTSIMYITHNMAVIAEIAQRVLVMYMGKDVELAPVDALFYDPRHPYTRALLRSIPRIDDEREMLAVMRGNVPDPYALPTGCPFHPRCESRLRVCSQPVEVPYVEVSPGHFVRCHLYAGGG